eukprot:scaffold2729_cov403-Prasinococcus_capsulatus_cf.AAC.10
MPQLAVDLLAGRAVSPRRAVHCALEVRPLPSDAYCEEQRASNPGHSSPTGLYPPAVRPMEVQSSQSHCSIGIGQQRGNHHRG